MFRLRRNFQSLFMIVVRRLVATQFKHWLLTDLWLPIACDDQNSDQASCQHALSLLFGAGFVFFFLPPFDWRKDTYNLATKAWKN